MDITLGRQLLGPSQVGRSDAERRADAERLKIAELAREFEASLLVQMVRQMRQSFLSEEEQEEGLGNATMIDTLDVELARELSARGGIGLGAMIEKAVGRLSTTGTAAPAAEGAGGPLGSVGVSTLQPGASASPARVLGAGTGEPEAMLGESGIPDVSDLVLPMGDGISSVYGWRADPFHGVRKFHAGLDFRAAYGREVPAAGAGRVVFAGEQGAYGQTVVVDHGGGVQTRYAHLSTVDAIVGQELARGNVVGRVGQTGRATGPHLHFEVLMDGRRVDPLQAARRLPDGLKNLTTDDDYAFDRASAHGPANGVMNED